MGSPASVRKTAAVRFAGHLLDARPDTVDFRDTMYVPTLTEVPEYRKLSEYKAAKVPILNQGGKGACTGFALATVAHYLLRTRKVLPSKTEVSPWMLYQMAQKFDQHDQSASYATGENPDVGATPRAAVKGWQKLGICQKDYYGEGGPTREYPELVADARLRPLGAYFRVNHQDLVAMHTALAEAGVLYAACAVHPGWKKVGKNGNIQFRSGFAGGHAFAIVGYDKDGFWIQNSWGSGWGIEGFGHLSYDDWLQNGSDVWVGRLGVPVELQQSSSSATLGSPLVRCEGYAQPELDPHVISIGENGFLRSNGLYGKSSQDVLDVFRKRFVEETSGWKKKRLLIYAHGGLVSEAEATNRIATYWSHLQPAEIYPVGIVWHTDYWTTLEEILKKCISRIRPEGVLDSLKDFMLDRLDDTLEPIARLLTGKAEWDDMKKKAFAASQEGRGMQVVAQGIAELLNSKDGAGTEIHLLGHSAGSILLAPFIRELTSDYKLRIESCTLWAPACTVEVFRECYKPAIESSLIRRTAIFTLDDRTEQNDDCAHIYRKSLLYLVSDAFESVQRVPLLQPDGEPILGMAKFLAAKGPFAEDRQTLRNWLKNNSVDWVTSPNQDPAGSRSAARAIHHAGFSTDDATFAATMARILKLNRSEETTNLSAASPAQLSRRRRGFDHPAPS
jgi:hypothetical protein